MGTGEATSRNFVAIKVRITRAISRHHGLAADGSDWSSIQLQHSPSSGAPEAHEMREAFNLFARKSLCEHVGYHAVGMAIFEYDST
jgi:hypothetical protein